MGVFDFFGDILGYNAEQDAMRDARSRYAALEQSLGKIPDYEYIEGAAPQYYQMPEEVKGQTISEDPQLRETELRALQGLKGRAEEGMTAADTADWMRKRDQVATEARGQEEAIINSMRSRGMGGGGTEYALRSGAGQNAIDRLAENEAAKASSNAELRALAELKGGQMAGEMRGEDFNVGNANADILNKFALENSRTRQEAQKANTALANAFTQNELAERRNVSKGNVDLGLKKQQTLAGIQGQQANMDLAGGVAKGNMYGSIGREAGNVVNGMLGNNDAGYTVSEDPLGNKTYKSNKKWSIW